MAAHNPPTFAAGRGGRFRRWRDRGDRAKKRRSQVRSGYFLPLAVEPLEQRLTLHGAAAAYFPPTQFQFAESGFLSPPAEGDAAEIATSYLNAHAAELGLTPADLTEPIVTDLYTDSDTGLTHVYLRQQVNGLEVAFAEMNVTVAAAGQVLSVGGSFVPGLSSRVDANSLPDISPAEAVRLAASELGLSLSAEPLIVSQGNDAARTHVITAPELSLDDIPVRLHYVPTEEGDAVLAWQLIVRTPNGSNWLDLSLQASDDGSDQYGDVVALNDWFEHASYNVIALPNESLQDGGFVIHSGGEDPVASPFGWHDTDGLAGPEFSDTRGNNVDAHLDRDGNNVPDVASRPDGGPALDFSGFTLDETQQPSSEQNQNAAVVNLFHMANVLHDIHYRYGFTESAGNFQLNNYGRGGAGNDALQADGQDNAIGGSTNNANFATPPDGLAPRLQLFEYTRTTPRRDSALDNNIIIHEYGHGVANRLTGGPANTGALSALQSRGLGEGWSDWYALMLLQRPEDEKLGGYGLGTYVSGDLQSGNGIRRQQYSFDMAIDPVTFASFGGGPDQSTEVHNTGEIWASALWDLNWLLIDKYGYDADLYTGYTGDGPGGAGNKLALKLVMDAMKVQPANPTFTQARDALLAADNGLTGGANVCEIWTAMARRGLGESAGATGASSSALTTSFDVPVGACGLTVTTTTPAVQSAVTTVPLDYVVNFSNAILISSVQPTDFQVDGVTASGLFVESPMRVTFRFPNAPFSEQGPHTMSIQPGSIVRASDDSPLVGFSASFRYDVVPLEVIATTPPLSGGMFSLPAPFTYEVNFSEPLERASLQASDLVLKGMPSAIVSNVSLDSGNRTARFTIGGITAEGILDISIVSAAVGDAFGNPMSSDFNASYIVDGGTVAFAPLTPESPIGALVYDATALGVISSAGDTDFFTLPINGGQKVTILVSATSGALQPTVELRDPTNTWIGRATAAESTGHALLQSLEANSFGNYTVAVEGAGGTSGAYTLRVILNASHEAEGRGGGSNDGLATAESIGSAGLNLGERSSRLAVVGATGAGPTLAAESFESGVIPSSITTYSSNEFGRVEVTAPGGTGNPSGFALVLDSSVPSNFVLNEAVYSIDLSGVVRANLSFSHIRFNDEATNLPLDFVGHVDGDGVAISDDGQRWRTILDSPINTAWTTFSIDLVEAAAAAGMSLGPDFQIKFQQYDNFSYPADGRAFDDIRIGVPDLVDTYSFAMAEGDSAAIVLSTSNDAAVELKVLDAGGNVLTSAIAGPTNLDLAIADFPAPAAGLYYLVATSAVGTTYNLAVTRNTAFDMEANNTLATAQSLRGAAGALGALGPLPSQLTTINFNELSPGPVHGVSVGGVTFGFTVGGTPSTDATFGGSGPGGTQHSSPPQLEGSTAGVLTMEFTTPVTTLRFPIAVSTGGTIVGAANVQLFDAVGGLAAAIPITTNVPAGLTFSEALFEYANGKPIKQARLTFNSLAAENFVVDDVAFTTAAAADADWYAIDVTSTSTTLRLHTSTPGDGPHGVSNLLNPRLELFGPSNTLVAAGTVLPDGRNELIQYQPSVAGVYRVRLTSENGTQGEYFLSRRDAPGFSDVTLTSSINEGESAVLSGSFTDPLPDQSHTLIIDWGPGQQITTLELPPGESTFATSHVYLDDLPGGGAADTIPVNATLTSSAGDSATLSASLTLLNVAPRLTVNSVESINEGEIAQLTGAITDPGIQDAFTLTIDWGDPRSPNNVETIDLAQPPAHVTWNPVWRRFLVKHQYLDDSPPGLTGDDYRVELRVEDDDGATGTTSASVTVINLAPQSTLVSSSQPLLEGAEISVLASASDAAGAHDTLDYRWRVLGSEQTPVATGDGAAAFQFTPPDDGQYRIELSVSDEDGGRTIVELPIVVQNVAPQAINMTPATDEDMEALVMLAAADVVADQLTYTIVDPPLHGTLTGTAPHLTYLPVANYHGADSFTFRVRDELIQSQQIGIVSVVVASVNDPPVAEHDGFILPEDASLAIEPSSLLQNDNDVEADPLIAIVVDGPSYGELERQADGTLVYSPASDYHGPDSFTYLPYDGVDPGNIATVQITVTSVNDAPTFSAGSDQPATDESGAISIAEFVTSQSPGAADETEQALTFIVSTNNPLLFAAPPSIDAAGTLTFVPRANANGTAQVSVYLQDDGGRESGGSDLSAAWTFLIVVAKPFPWHNTAQSLDVNNDSFVSAIDLLLIFNYLNSHETGEVPADALSGPSYYDTSKDQFVSSVDALRVVNFLNGGGVPPSPQSGPIAPPEDAFFQALGSQPVNPSEGDLAALLAAFAEGEAESPGRARRRL